MTELMTHNGELYIPSGYNSTMYFYKDKARQALTISCEVNTRTPATMVDYTNIISNNDTSSCFFLLRNLDYLNYGWFLLETNLGSIVTDTKAGHDWAVPHECNYVQIDSQGHRMTGEIDCTDWGMNLGSQFGPIKVNFDKATMFAVADDAMYQKWHALTISGGRKPYYKLPYQCFYFLKRMVRA